MNMRKGKVLISTFLVVLIGLTFCLDLWASGSRVGAHELGLSQLQGRATRSSEAPAISLEELDSDRAFHDRSCGSAPCNDPCHSGNGHFGHCSCVHGQKDFRFQIVVVLGDFEIRPASHREAPFLEGPRRPPRRA